MTNDELLSKTISWLRFPLAVGVVFIHGNFIRYSVIVQGVTYETQNPICNTIVNVFSEVLPRIAVPLFFLISGFLFFYHTEFNILIYKRKLKSRVRTLLVPYLIWSTLAFLYPLLKFIPGLESLFPGTVGFEFDMKELFKGFWAQTNSNGHEFMPRNTPLWFVRELIVMVVFTPVVHWLIFRMDYIIVLLLAALWFIIPRSLPALCPMAWFFFVLGAYFSVKHINPLSFLRNHQWLLCLYLVIAVVDVVTKEWGGGQHLHP